MTADGRQKSQKCAESNSSAHWRFLCVVNQRRPPIGVELPDHFRGPIVLIERDRQLRVRCDSDALSFTSRIVVASLRVLRVKPHGLAGRRRGTERLGYLLGRHTEADTVLQLAISVIRLHARQRPGPAIRRSGHCDGQTRIPQNHSFQDDSRIS